MDNASINNTIIDFISTDLKEESIAYDTQQHRLRCNSHIINLTVSAFLYGKHPDNERQAYRSIKSQIGTLVQKLNTWRRQGPLCKLPNIIVYIMASPQQIQVFT